MMAVLTVLLLIFMGQFFGRYLAWAAEGFISSSIVFDMLMLRTLGALNVMLPFALYLSVLIAFGRLYKDSEMTALSASGVSLGNILRPVFFLSFFFMLIVGAFSFYITPWANDHVLQLREQTESAAKLEGIVAGQFAQIKSENAPVFYAEDISEETQSMNNVFVQIREGDELVIYSARQGMLIKDPDTGVEYFLLSDGYRYQMTPGKNKINIQNYKKSAFRMEDRDVVFKQRTQREKPTSSLFQNLMPLDIAEIQWRTALPLSVLLLPMLAVLLSKTSPRQGRFAKLLVAIVIFIIYNNALSVSKSWIETSQIPAMLGMWWVHLGLLLYIIFLYSRHSGWLQRKKYQRLMVS
jgi:lipopolysaccharide export system permease protein